MFWLGALSVVEKKTGMIDDLGKESEEQLCSFLEDTRSTTVESIPTGYFVNAIASKKHI